MQGTKTLQLKSTARKNGKPLKNGRDSQKSKVYAAEQVIRGRAGNIGGRAANELAQKIAASKYVQNNYGIVRPTIQVSNARKRTSAAFYWEQRIVLAAAWGCTTDVVIHEMAHLYASPAGDPGHDWLFCSIYLDLVRKFMGQVAHDDLKLSFKAHKVRFTPPRAKRQMTPAQKAAASARMAKARAARGQASVEPHVIVIPRHERIGGWAMISGQSLPKSGWLKTTSYMRQALVRKTDKGILDAVVRVRTWPGATEAMAVPVSTLDLTEFGSLNRDWYPGRVTS